MELMAQPHVPPPGPALPRRRRARAEASESLGGALTLPFVLALVYVFVEYVRPQEKYELVYGMPLGVGSLVAFILAVLLSGQGLSMGGPVGKWVLALLAWALPCALLSPDPAVAMDVYWETLKIVPVYFLIVSAVRTRAQLYLFVLWLLFIYFMHTNFSFRAWAMSGFSGAGAGSYVGSGFLHNPNDYGIWLSSFWGVSLLLALYDRRKVFGKVDVRWVHAAGTGLFVVGALTSSSRGTAVGVAAGVVYFILMHVKSIKARVGGVVLTVAGVAAFLFLLSEEQSVRFQNMGSEEDASAQERINTWRVAWRLAQDYPITGTGIGQFVNVGQRYAGGEPLFVQHNITLQALTELGFPGLVLFLGIIVAFFAQRRRSIRVARERGDPLLMGLGIGVSVSMVSFLVNGQFITVLFYPFLWILLAVAGVLHDLTSAPARVLRPVVRPGGRRQPVLGRSGSSRAPARGGPVRR